MGCVFKLLEITSRLNVADQTGHGDKITKQKSESKKNISQLPCNSGELLNQSCFKDDTNVTLLFFKKKNETNQMFEERNRYFLPSDF